MLHSKCFQTEVQLSSAVFHAYKAFCLEGSQSKCWSIASIGPERKEPSTGTLVP